MEAVAPETANKVEAKLLLKHIKDHNTVSSPHLPTATTHTSITSTLVQPASSATPVPATLTQGTKMQLVGIPLRLVSATAEALRWDLLHWSAEEAARRKQDQEAGVVTGRPVPRGGLQMRARADS